MVSPYKPILEMLVFGLGTKYTRYCTVSDAQALEAIKLLIGRRAQCVSRRNPIAKQIIAIGCRGSGRIGFRYHPIIAIIAGRICCAGRICIGNRFACAIGSRRRRHHAQGIDALARLPRRSIVDGGARSGGRGRADQASNPIIGIAGYHPQGIGDRRRLTERGIAIGGDPTQRIALLLFESRGGIGIDRGRAEGIDRHAQLARDWIVD
ncbi:hypothetical protein Hgul01_05137 [Herpetosiphon gulosus]|uniref:Uncharacterized protein n=1 Tax=Herpetosiphon gulosus TaxID=1973496 RepID=A0ABP9X7D6_9CHLR